LAAFIATTHAPVPVQSPVQPTKVLLAKGVAVTVTFVPLAKLKLHVEPQLIPVGLLVTEPAPVPELVTVIVGLLSLSFTYEALDDDKVFVIVSTPCAE
jgi:hypothetical protein